MQNFLGDAWDFGRSALRGANGQFGRGAILSVVLVGFGTILVYLSQVIISRSVGAAEFGIYAYVLGLLNIGRLLVTVSLDLAAVRFVSIYHSSGNWSLFNGFISMSRLTVTLLSILGAIVGILLTVTLRGSLKMGLPEALAAGCVLLVPMALLTLELSFLQALRLVYQSRIPYFFIRPLVLLAVILVAIHLLGLPGTAVLALYANAAGCLVAFLVSFYFMQSQRPAVARGVLPSSQTKEWSSFCIVTLGQNLVYLVLSQQADVVIVGSMIGTTHAGYYSAASQIATLILLGVMTVNQFVSPMLAQYHASDSRGELRVLLSRILLVNTALSLPLIAAVTLLGPYLLHMFGPSFVVAYPVIVVLAVGCLVNGLWGALWGDLLTMTGYHRVATVIVIAVAILNLALTIILTPRYGILGAAYATTIAVILRGILVAYVVRREFDFWPWTIWRLVAKG